MVHRTHQGCIALWVGVVHHTALGVVEVHRTGLGVEEAHHTVLLVEVAVGRQEFDHREYGSQSLVAVVETDTALLVGTVLVAEPHTVLEEGIVVHREVGLLRMAAAGAAGAAVVVGVGCCIAG